VGAGARSGSRDQIVAGRRYRLQLIGKQERQAARIAGCWRAVWNAALEQRRVVRQLRRPNVWGVQQMAELPGLKRSEGFEWLGEDAIAQSLQQTPRDLDTAYRRYFAGLGGCPRFKRKRRGESFRLPQGRDLPVRKLNRRWSEVRIAKLGWCRFRLSRPIGGEIRHATVSRDALGWHVSFCVALDQRPAQPHDGPAVGVDRGVAASVALSTGALCRCPELRGRQGKRLGGFHARLGVRRPPAGTVPTITAGALHATSARWTRSAGCARETRIRNDFVHKLSIELANSHGLIVIEDLRIKNLTRSAKGTLAQPRVNVAQKRANAKRDCAARPAASLNMLT